MSDPKPAGLFSSLTLARNSRSPRPSETLAHPLLGASTSSLNLPVETEVGGSTGLSISPQGPTLSPKASSTFSRITTDTLPYKPRQRHAHQNSTGSIAGSVSPGLTATAGTALQTAPPTTSTSSTFALPPSATETINEGNVAGSSTASATARLQVQSLKASAQRMGLGNGSVGMAMIDAMVDKGQSQKMGAKPGEGGDWAEILRLLMGDKAILLLPMSASSSLPITPQIMREHIAFLSSPIPLEAIPPSRIRSSDSLLEKGKEVSSEVVSVVVTLSGMIGTIQGDVLTIETILDLDAPLLSAIRDPIARPSVLAALRPATLSLKSTFPSYTLSAQTSTLAFPPLGKSLHGTSDSKDKETAKSSASKIGRMNPFASFFGSSASSSSSLPATSAPRSSTPEAAALQSGTTSNLSPSSGSPKLSVLSVIADDTASILSDEWSKDAEGYSVSAYTVTKPIRVSEVQKSLSKAVRSYIKDALSRLPEKVVDRVTKLVQASVCSPSGGIPEAPKSSSGDASNIPILDFAHPAKVSEQLQDFLESIYDDLFDYFRNDSSHFVAEAGLKRKGSGGKPWSRASLLSEKANQEEGGSKEAKERRRREREERAETEGTAGTERVEALITTLLYNRLFSPLGSDDARHDEALASRIAALNMLDLSLDHLGLITRPNKEEIPGTIASGLLEIVDDIGNELQKLITPDCLTPKAKVGVLIKAHQIVVDGLAQMPPVQLRPEGEAYISSPPPPDVPSDDSEQPDLTGTELTSMATSVLPASPPSSALSFHSSPPEKHQQEAITDDGQAELARGSQTAESSQLEEAMDDSVLTLQPNSSSRDDDTASQLGSESPAPRSPTTASAPTRTSTSGADLILPIIIFAVVRANPPQLASQLMYLRRYRSAICLTGEASYAMVNLTAVVEFLEHVDLAELGLGGESDKVMSVADLSPIGLNYLDESSEEAQSIASASSRLRGRVFQVGELAGTAAGSANKVITGVIDSSWSAVRGLISTATPAAGDSVESTSAEPARPGLQARQPSTFSLASVTASVASIAAAAAATTAAARSRASSTAGDKLAGHHWQGNQEMIDVTSRPVSIKEEQDKEEYPSDTDSATSDHGDHIDKTDPFTHGGTALDRNRALSDARSIRSVSSVMSKEGRREDAGRSTIAERVSLSDRLANIGGFGKPATGGSSELSNNPSPEKDAPSVKPTGFLASLAASRSTSSTGQGQGRRGSLLSGVPDVVGRLRSDSNPSLSAKSPTHTPSVVLQEAAAPQPIERFMTCDLGDIQLSELGELLRDYRRLGAYVTGLSKGTSTAGLSQSVSNGT